MNTEVKETEQTIELTAQEKQAILSSEWARFPGKQTEATKL